MSAGKMVLQRLARAVDLVGGGDTHPAGLARRHAAVICPDSSSVDMTAPVAMHCACATF
jgi:hypothetical protein